MTGFYPRAREIFKWAAEVGSNEIAGQTRLGKLLSGEPNDYDEIEEFDAQIYTALSSLVSGEGFDIVTSSNGRFGLEAWRRL